MRRMSNKKDCKAPYPALGTELTNNNIGVCAYKDIDNKHEYSLFNFQYHFDTIVKSIKNLSIILISNSIILILCYASVDIIYITKNYSYSKVKLCEDSMSYNWSVS